MTGIQILSYSKKLADEWRETLETLVPGCRTYSRKNPALVRCDFDSGGTLIVPWTENTPIEVVRYAIEKSVLESVPNQVDERTSVDPDIPPRADGMAVTFDHVREDATHSAVFTLIDLVDACAGSDLAALHKLKRAAIELHNAIHLLDSAITRSGAT